MFIEAGRIYFTCLFHHCCMAECTSFFQHIVRLPSHLTVTLRNFLHLYHVLLYLYLYCPKDICHNGLHTSRFSSSRGCRMVSLLEFHYKHIFSNRCIFYYYSFSSDEFLTKFRASSNPSFVLFTLTIWRGFGKFQNVYLAKRVCDFLREKKAILRCFDSLKVTLRVENNCAYCIKCFHKNVKPWATNVVEDCCLSITLLSNCHFHRKMFSINLV